MEFTREPGAAGAEKSPAAGRVLDVLTYVAGKRAPVGAQRIAGALGLPRSSVYQLLRALVDRGYLAHFPEEQTFGLGLAAFELSSAYGRHEPLARAARPVLERLVDSVGESGHVAVLRGQDVIYVAEERAPHRPSLVTDVGVRLPAHLTASGRALLGVLPAAQVRAMYPAGGSTATGETRSAGAVRLDSRIPGEGPGTLRELRALLARDAERGYSEERGEVTADFHSVAVAARDRAGMPLAALAITFLGHRYDDDARAALARRVADSVRELERRLG